MLPNDFIELVMKVVFVVTAAFMLCISRVKAHEITQVHQIKPVSYQHVLK